MIRSQLGRMSALGAGFALYSNAFSSSIPSQLGGMTSMSTGYYLCMNSLTNSVPSELGRLSILTTNFRLDTNQVRCFVSYTWVCLMCAAFLLCTLCFVPQLSNSLPSEIGGLTAMSYYVYMHKNSLSSSLP